MTDERSKSPFRRLSSTAPLKASGPTGFLPSLRRKAEQLFRDIEGLSLRLDQPLPEGEPAAAVGRRVFLPESAAFAFDFMQDGSSSVQAQYVVRSGQTYDIPVIFPPPGVFRAARLCVNITQRVYDPSGAVQLYPVVANDVYLSQIDDGFQTLKFSYPFGYNAAQGSSFRYQPARLNFFWNLIDNKSGLRLSDQWLPDTLLLPQAPTTRPYANSDAFGYSPSNGGFDFDVPWLFERDADITFQFRPINDVVQPTAATGAIWRSTGDQIGDVFDDRQFNGSLRNNSVQVAVELHGSRHYFEQDARRIGALSRDD